MKWLFRKILTREFIIELLYLWEPYFENRLTKERVDLIACWLRGDESKVMDVKRKAKPKKKKDKA